MIKEYIRTRTNTENVFEIDTNDNVDGSSKSSEKESNNKIQN